MRKAGGIKYPDGFFCFLVCGSQPRIGRTPLRWLNAATRIKVPHNVSAARVFRTA
jgi:hypothetical protein